MDDFIPDSGDFIPDPPEKQGKSEHVENLLQRAIKAARIGPFGGTSITAALPASGQEATDMAKVAGRQIPGMRGGDINFFTQGPSGLGINMAGINKASEVIPPPETQYGKNLETSADIAPWVALGLEGATAGIDGIKNAFSTGTLPQDIEATKGSIQDIIHTGPQKVKARVGQIFDESQADFGNRISSIPGDFNAQMTSSHFADALEGAASEMGASNVPGSSANKMIMMAQEMRNNPRSFYPEEIQAQSKAILQKLDPLSKAKFYHHFSDILSQQVPELASIKSDYAPVYDIAKQSKVINKGNLGRVASGKIGPEQLGQMTQAQQMMGDNPNVVEAADAGGRKLNQQQNDLEKIIGRQNSLKGAAKTVGKGALFTAGGGGIYELLHHFFHE